MRVNVRPKEGQRILDAHDDGVGCAPVDRRGRCARLLYVGLDLLLLRRLSLIRVRVVPLDVDAGHVELGGE